MREVPGPRPVRARRAGFRSLATALLATASAPAIAQGLQPQVGAPVELGDLRQTFERVYDRQPRIPDRAWTITPAIDLQVSATNNAAGLGVNNAKGGGDILTTLTPSIGIQGETSKLRGSLFYAPQLTYYAVNTNQNGINQNLGGNGTLTIFEDLLTLNASAYATDTAARGGLAPTPGVPIAAQNRIQTTSFQVGPQLSHRFGDYGRFEAGYTFSYLNQYGQGVIQPNPFTAPFNQGVTTTNTGFVKFTSGEVFGRFFFSPIVSGVVYDGTGVLDGAYRYAQVVSLGYAVTRGFTVIGDLGHQNLYYAGTTPYKYDGLTWALGARWQPDPDSRFTFTYGKRDGGTNYYFDGTTAPTARTRLTARYSEGVSTGAEQIQSAILAADFDSYGVPIDRNTGAPLAFTSNFGGMNGNVSRVSSFSVTGALLRDLDTYSLSLQYQAYQTLSSNTINAGPNNSAWVTGTLAYQRQISQALSGSTTVSYSARNGQGAGTATQQTVSLTAGLFYALSETLSTRALFTYSHSNSNTPGFGYDMSMITVGLRKGF